MSYCRWPMFVVRRASSDVRRQQFALNNISLYDCPVYFYHVCSNGGPEVQNGPSAGDLGFKNEINLKNLLLQSCLAQVLEIWYVVLPYGRLPSLFKPRSQGPILPIAMGS